MRSEFDGRNVEAIGRLRDSRIGEQIAQREMSRMSGDLVARWHLPMHSRIHAETRLEIKTEAVLRASRGKQGIEVEFRRSASLMLERSGAGKWATAVSEQMGTEVSRRFRVTRRGRDVGHGEQGSHASTTFEDRIGQISVYLVLPSFLGLF